MTVTIDAFLVTCSLRECLAKRDADILDRVVIVDVRVATGLDVDIDQAMTRDLVKHVLQERDTYVEG